MLPTVLDTYFGMDKVETKTSALWDTSFKPKKHSVLIRYAFMMYFFFNYKEMKMNANTTPPDAKQTVTLWSTKRNFLETISLWSMGRNFLNSDEGPEGLVEDYKLIAGDFKETLNGGHDAVQFSIEASNKYSPDVTLKECAEALKGEVRAMAKTVGEVLVIPDDTLDQIDKIVDEYSEKNKHHKKSEQGESNFSIGIGVEMQTVGDEDDGYKIKVDVRTFADYENLGLEDDEEECFEEKTLYFDMIAKS